MPWSASPAAARRCYLGAVTTLRRAKIVCTLGPAVDDGAGVAGLAAAGMDVARLNYSHGTHEEHARRAESVRAASRSSRRPIALLMDLCGPKIRTGRGGPAEVVTGGEIRLFAGSDSTPGEIAVGYDTLCDDLEVGDPILLGDGDVQLQVTRKDGDRLVCTATHGGALRSRMGVNLPSSRVRLGAFTDKDLGDLAHGLSIGVDYVALSFVRSEAEVVALRKHIEARGKRTPIVAKIETPQALARLDAIVDAADAVMVARGDLGLELPPETVPTLQKRILAACREQQKPAIVATEMLQSMVHSPRPTRAEASDVANAVFDGADALMLSAETASGDHPLLACKMMDRIIRDAETSPFYHPPASPPGATAAEAIALSAREVAERIGARLVVALTQSGSSARLVSKARPRVPVLAVSPEDETLRRLALYWGVVPRHLPRSNDLDQLIDRVCEYLVRAGLADKGDRYVVVYGAPLGVQGSTNALRVEVVR